MSTIPDESQWEGTPVPTGTPVVPVVGAGTRERGGKWRHEPRQDRGSTGLRSPSVSTEGGGGVTGITESWNWCRDRPSLDWEEEGFILLVPDSPIQSPVSTSVPMLSHWGLQG